MFSGFPALPLAQEVAEFDVEHEEESPMGCVKTTRSLPVETVLLTFPALCALLHHAESSTRYRSIYGRLCGLQTSTQVEVTEVLQNPIKEPKVRDDNESPEQREKRQREETQAMQSKFDRIYDIHQQEELDSYQVGIFVVTNALHSPYNTVGLKQLMDLQRNSQPHLLLVYDALRTGILGRPYIRAFVPTESYINYYNRTQEKSAVHMRQQDLLQQYDVTKYGVLREVPVEIGVDAYHALNFENFVTVERPNSFEVIQQPVIMDYVKALVDAVQDGTESLTQTFESEGKLNAKEQNPEQPLAQRVDALLSLQYVRELAQHLEGICDSLLLNTSMMREL